MKIRLGILCGLVLFGVSGCGTFRALFDETPEEKTAKRMKAKQAAAAGEESETGLGIRAQDEEKAVRDRMKRDSETYEDWVFGGNPLKN